ncbi:hypothetical protein [Nostoc sp.]
MQTEIQHPDPRINDECLRFWLSRKGWFLFSPYAQWNYWHIIKKDGGILPLNVEWLLDEYLGDPLSSDEVAIAHRKVIHKVDSPVV